MKHLTGKPAANRRLWVVISVCWSLLFGAAPGYAADILERRIDVSFQQTPLKEALATVARKGGFEWSYNANIVDASRRISLIARDWTVRETLYELLGDGYEFKNNGDYLILKKRKKPAGELSGYVKDGKTGQRIANATVYDRRTLRATTTDSNGYYQLRVRKSTEIAIARLDYRDTVFAVASNSPRFQKLDLQVNSPSITDNRSLRENLQRAATQAERLFRASLGKWAALNVPDSLHRRFQLSLFPKLGTNHTLSGKVVNDWSVNLVAGASLGNRRAEVAGFGNFTRKDMTGVQAAGAFNELHGNATGAQLSGLYNHAGDTLRGVQAAGAVNIAGHARGWAVQLGGIGNFIGLADGPTIQAGGLLNRSRGGKVFAQLSGGANQATYVEGLQAAGAVNSVDTLYGVQVATICNRARKVRGLQIGLINSTHELHGLQIGLINRSGRRVLPIINW